jgi:hypothetical protein
MILDTDLLATFARAMALQAKHSSAKLLVAIACARMLEEDACVTMSAFRESLGLSVIECIDTRALIWRDFQADAIKTSLLWSKESGTVVRERWFSHLYMSICHTPSTS